MGSFFHGYKVQCFSNSMPLIDNSGISIKELVLMSVLYNTSIPDGFISRTIHGSHKNIKAYYEYAKEHYILGLPEGNTGNFSSVDETVLLEAIAEDVGYPVQVYDYTVAPLSAALVALPYLIETRQFDLDSTLVANPPSEFVLFPVDSYTHVYVYSIRKDDVEDLIHITYIAPPDEPDFVDPYADKFYTETIPLNPNDDFIALGTAYCIAEYSARGSSTSNHDWWFYSIEQGKYLELTASFTELQTQNTFMPVIPIRYKNKDLTVAPFANDDMATLASDARIMVKKLGMPLDIIASRLNDNPDIDEIDNAYIMHGVDLNRATEAQLYYLGTFFHALSTQAYFTEINYLNYAKYSKVGFYNGYRMRAPAVTSIGILESLAYGASITFDFITSSEHVGDIGKPGFAKYEVTHHPTIWIDWNDPEPADTYILTLSYQIRKNMYRKLVIQNLSHRNDVYRHHAVITELSSISDPDNHNFVIPLHFGLCMQLPKAIRENVFADSLCLILNSYVKTAIPWYAQGWFVMVKMIISIIVSIWCQACGMAAMAGMHGAQLIVQIMLRVLMMVIVSQAFKYIAEALGPEVAAILGVIVLVLGAAGGMMGSDTTYSVMGTQMTTAQMLLSASMCLFKGASSVIKDSLADVQDALEDFQEEAAKKWDLLEEAVESLAPHNLLDVGSLIYGNEHRFDLHVEDPSDFFHRTIHQGNIGVLVKDALHEYHNVALMRPELKVADTQYALA